MRHGVQQDVTGHVGLLAAERGAPVAQPQDTDEVASVRRQADQLHRARSSVQELATYLKTTPLTLLSDRRQISALLQSPSSTVLYERLFTFCYNAKIKNTSHKQKLCSQLETPKHNINNKITTRKLQMSYFSLKTRIE